MKKNTCFVMLAALMMAGCSNEIDEQVMDSRRVPLQINGDINMLMTRAADDHWDEEDAIGVYMVSAENSIVGDVSNYRYTAVAGGQDGTFIPADENNTAYFPEDGTAVNVMAYYPQGEVTDGKLLLDLANQDEQPKIDLMAANATGASADNPIVELQFGHKLTKLFFKITSDDNINTDNISAKINNQYTNIRYDVLGDELSVQEGDELKEITLKYWNLDEGKNRFVEAIVLPNMEGNSAQERTLTFTLNGKDYKATINAQTVFEAGKKYIYTVTFTTEGSVKIQGAGITNWDIEDGGPEIEVKPETTIYITGAIGGGWNTYSKMDKKSNNIYVWTGIIKENEAFKFTFDETYDHGKVQIMSSSEKKETDVVTLEEGTESDIFKVVYAENGADNKWTVAESGTYMVKLDMDNNKISIEKKIFILGLDGDYTQDTAPSFAKVGDGRYELTVTFSKECSFNMPLWSSAGWDMDCYMPVEENNKRASFTPGTTMKVIKQNRNIKDVQWQVTTEQTGTYQLTLDVSDSNDMTLTAVKSENQQ